MIRFMCVFDKHFVPDQLTSLNQALMEENPEFFKLPKGVWDHPDHTATLLSLMKTLLTVIRSQMKQKVCVLLDHNFGINTVFFRSQHLLSQPGPGFERKQLWS